MTIKRNEILLLIYSNPSERKGINKSYDDYKKMGGNSYIDDVIRDWRQKQDSK
jgi:tryptophan synthase alpha subunit